MRKKEKIGFFQEWCCSSKFYRDYEYVKEKKFTLTFNSILDLLPFRITHYS